MNADELEKFKQLLAAYDQALRLQRMRERTIETYRHNLWKAAKHFNRCPDVRWSGFPGQPPSLTSEAGHRP